MTESHHTPRHTPRSSKPVEELTMPEMCAELNRAWLIAQRLIQKYGPDSEIGVDCARLQATIDRISPLPEVMSTDQVLNVPELLENMSAVGIPVIIFE